MNPTKASTGLALAGCIKTAVLATVVGLGLSGCGRQFPAPLERPRISPTPLPATFTRFAVWARAGWNPTCVYLTRSGILLVAEDSTRVQNYGALGYRQKAQPINIYSFSGLTRPVQIAEGGSGISGAASIFIADMGNGTPAKPITIFEFIPVGEPPFAPVRAIRDTNWVRIRGLAADPGQNVFVSCDARVRVDNPGSAPSIEEQSAIYRYHGGLRDTVAEQGTGVGTVVGAHALMWDDGYLYVADTDKDWAQKLDATQKNLGLFKVDGTEGEGLSGLKAPRGVGADGQGYFYVTDTGHGRVLRYATSGAFDQVVNQYDTLSTGQSGNLSAPATVSAGYLNGKLYCYVGDPVTHQINVYGFQR